MKALKQIVEISSLILALLIFSGFLKLEIYYQNWDIKVIDYLDLSEILVLFLNDIEIFLLFTVIMFLHITLGMLLTKNGEKPTITIKNFKVNVAEATNTKIGKIFFYIITVSAISILYYNFIANYNLCYLYIISFVGMQFVIKSVDWIFIKNESIKNASLSIAYITAFIFFTISIAQYHVYHKEKDLDKYIFIMRDGSSIISNTEILYLGKTKNFCYFFNKKEKTTKIINTEDVKEINRTSR